MKNIEAVVQLEFDDTGDSASPKYVKEVLSGPRRSLVEIKLHDNAILPKHKAVEPITVLCLSGSGTFRAGPELEDAQKLSAGTLVTLAPDVQHEIVAEPAVHVLVTKFRND